MEGWRQSLGMVFDGCKLNPNGGVSGSPGEALQKGIAMPQPLGKGISLRKIEKGCVHAISSARRIGLQKLACKSLPFPAAIQLTKAFPCERIA